MTSRARRTAIVWWLLAPVLLLAQIAFLYQFRGVVELYGAGRFSYHQADAWRLGTPPVDSLERFLRQAEPLIPAGSRVFFSSRESPGDQTGHRFAWAAYLLPRHQLIAARRSPALAEADYWIAYRTSARGDATARSSEDLSRLELLLDAPDGRVYRIEP